MKVYIAGPYTKGDVVTNVRNAIEVANDILELGHEPYIPHLTHLWHLVTPKPYEKWLEIDAAWIKSCDMVLRIPGESSGADKEVIIAKSLGIPVVYSFKDIPNGLV